MEFSRFWLLFLSCAILFEELHATPIVGGRDVKALLGSETKYPFIVSLQDVEGNGNTKHFCGGSLIGSRWILTAAHCLWRKDITKVVAYIGYESLENSERKAEADIYKLKTVVLNDFQPISYQNDIALVSLDRDFVGPAKFAILPDYGMEPNRNSACTIMGYGAMGPIGLTSNRLLEANVYVITNRECREKLGHVWAPKPGDNTICAVGENQDACQGDSGGPLLCPYGDTNYIYGIVSHGLACGGKGIPSIYSVTVPHTKWIRHVISNY